MLEDPTQLGTESEQVLGGRLLEEQEDLTQKLLGGSRKVLTPVMRPENIPMMKVRFAGPALSGQGW